MLTGLHATEYASRVLGIRFGDLDQRERKGEGCSLLHGKGECAIMETVQAEEVVLMKRCTVASGIVERIF